MQITSPPTARHTRNSRHAGNDERTGSFFSRSIRNSIVARPASTATAGRITQGGARRMAAITTMPTARPVIVRFRIGFTSRIIPYQRTVLRARSSMIASYSSSSSDSDISSGRSGGTMR